MCNYRIRTCKSGEGDATLSGWMAPDCPDVSCPDENCPDGNWLGVNCPDENSRDDENWGSPNGEPIGPCWWSPKSSGP